jgi:signal transduction histidine kinase/ActR/RegA family two-component response regulator
VINDVANEHGAVKGFPKGHLTLKRYMGVPVFDGDKIVAVACVGGKQSVYDESDTRQLILLMQGMWTIVQQQRAEAALRESEEKLARSRKMESLGLLAGGVAHDLNNILSGIIGYPEIILMDLPEDSNLKKPVTLIQDCGRRAADTVQDLLTIARGAAVAKEPLDLNEMVDAVLGSPEFKKMEQSNPAVAVDINLGSGLLHIGGSPAHIKKVVMNLMTNAFEAISESGKVTISTANRYIDKPVKGYDDVTIGEYVVLSVSDNGAGISSDDLGRIFEPFYTKKFLNRRGTGLGLAVVWNVVQEHKGYIDVAADKKGTLFDLYFPITRDDIWKESTPLSIKEFKGRGETVLVVDDEAHQREILCKMSDMLGYKAKAVSSGEEAVAYMKDNSADLILLDMIMSPGINGRETYEKILQIHPGQKAIIVSGYAETEEVKKAQRLGARQYIRKPVEMDKLWRAMSRELGRRRADQAGD